VDLRRAADEPHRRLTPPASPLPASVGAIVLAAGSGTRMGGPKHLLAVAGRPMAQHAIDAAVAAGLSPVIVVLGAGAEVGRSALRLPGDGRIVVNPHPAEGQAGSLAVGLEAAEACAAVVVLLADQPGVSAETIRAVLEGAAAVDRPVVRARYADGPSHPVLLRRAVFDRLRTLTGDEGARTLVASEPELLHEVGLEGPRPPDVDTPEDHRRLAGEPG
jgi:molybdenum cofactor cytidylyltransferase